MKSNLRDLPLFTGERAQGKAEFDFTTPRGVDDVNLIFTINRKLAEALVAYAKQHDKSPNALLEVALKDIAT
jgi:hypothetical protein